MFCIGCIISAVVECRKRGVTQKKLVELFLKSIDNGCEGLSDEAASNITRGCKNPSGYLMEALGKRSADSYKDIAEYFRDQIVMLIKENERSIVKDTLILMLQESWEISDDTVVEAINGIKKAHITEANDLADLLAGVFIYALNDTKNNIGGTAKDTAREYLSRVRSGEKPKREKTSINEEVLVSKSEPDHSNPDYCSREVELMEERIDQEAIVFCRKYEKIKDFIALCQVAYITNPTRAHHRKMYNEFCELTASTRKRILEINGLQELKDSGDDWWYEYLQMFKKDYSNYELGSDRYLYMFGQYFPRLIGYGGASIRDSSQRLFLPKVITPFTGLIPGTYKHNVAGLIDEYINYKIIEKSNLELEPPMDLMWRELDFGSCPELMLAAFLAQFIIGTCRGIPTQKDSLNAMFVFNGPGASEVETAEDLFYQAVLTLYENYELAT